MNKVLILLILSLLMVGCDIGYSPDIPESSGTEYFYSLSSTDGLYISRSNGRYIGGQLMNIYGIIRNVSEYAKNFVKIKIILKDDYGSHLNTYTRSFGPVESGGDIPFWDLAYSTAVHATAYELEIVEASEYHNTPADLVGLYHGYHSFSYDIIDSSLTQEEGTSLWRYTVTIEIMNMNGVDLDSFYLESLLYATNGLIVDYDNEYSVKLFESGETKEFTLSYLLQEGESVWKVDFWGSGR